MENAIEQEEKKKNKKFLLLIILLGGLTIFSAFSGYVAFVKNPAQMEDLNAGTENHKSRAQKLQGEMDKISSMLDNIGVDGSAEGLEEFKDEHIAIKEEAAKHKEHLLRLQSKMKQLIEMSDGATDSDSFVAAYRKLKADHWALNNEVSKLRRRNKNLVADNRKLKTENKSLSAEVDQAKEDVGQLREQTNFLKQQVEKAAILNVHELNANGIRSVRGGREKVSTKARKSEKIRIGFTLPKNDVATPGTKTVYLVIKDPMGQYMTDGGSNFKFEGKNMAYTVKDQVEYNNEAKDMMMYGKNLFKEKMDKGTYSIEIYCDGAKIGSTELFLK